MIGLLTKNKNRVKQALVLFFQQAMAGYLFEELALPGFFL
jgi:hypothetical protein